MSLDIGAVSLVPPSQCKFKDISLIQIPPGVAGRIEFSFSVSKCLSEYHYFFGVGTSFLTPSRKFDLMVLEFGDDDLISWALHMIEEKNL